MKPSSHTSNLTLRQVKHAGGRTYTCSHIYICIYLCVYIYIHTHTHGYIRGSNVQTKVAKVMKIGQGNIHIFRSSKCNRRHQPRQVHLQEQSDYKYTDQGSINNSDYKAMTKTTQHKTQCNRNKGNNNQQPKAGNHGRLTMARQSIQTHIQMDIMKTDQGINFGESPGIETNKSTLRE